MRFKDNECGQVMVITALYMVGSLGFLAFAIDVGILFHTRWQLQVAADAAATAAAVEYLHNGYNSTAADAVGNAAALANNASDGNTMTANVVVNANAVSPSSHKGCAGTTCFFEAIVSKPNPTIFYRTFFALWKSADGGAFTVSARAVAGTPSTTTGCMYLAGSTGNVFDANGNYQINAPGCGLYVNSSSSSAMTGNGNKGKVNVASVTAVGSTSSYSANFPPSTTMTGNVIPQTIPFTSFTAPTAISCVTAPGNTITASTGPGCYNGNVTIGGGAILAAGTYIFTGNVTINGSFTAHNVAFDINSGTFNVNPGNATIDWTPPTSSTDPFNAISIYQPLTNTNAIQLQAGSVSGSITGFIVAPGAQLSMQDNGGSMTIGGLVVASINNGPATLTITGYSPSTSPLKLVTLVE
jgi:hypothetical protein